MLKDQIKASKPPTFYFIVYPFTPQQMQSLWENFGNILVLYFLLLSKRAFLSFFMPENTETKKKKGALNYFANSKKSTCARVSFLIKAYNTFFCGTPPAAGYENK